MYKIVVDITAQEELEAAEFYYFKISEKVSDKFIVSVFRTYFLLESNPHFSIRIKNYHTISISKFPYLLFYEIDEENKIVRILSYFHSSQNPEKYPI